MHSNNDGMDPNWRPPDSDPFDETQFARAERYFRECCQLTTKVNELEKDLATIRNYETSELGKAHTAIARLRHINNKFKVHGTDGCKSCETGRVTLFIANDECISCNPESYELVTPQEASK